MAKTKIFPHNETQSYPIAFKVLLYNLCVKGDLKGPEQSLKQKIAVININSILILILINFNNLTI